MMSKFTEKAERVINRALEYACSMGHTYVGSEHILLGLTAETDSVGAKLLSGRGAVLSDIEQIIAGISGTGDRSNVTPADMTPRTKNIIESSAYIAA